jgi:hypothetical protein
MIDRFQKINICLNIKKERQSVSAFLPQFNAREVVAVVALVVWEYPRFHRRYLRWLKWLRYVSGYSYHDLRQYVLGSGIRMPQTR